MRYYARRWPEARGDQHGTWGPATYYFESDDAGRVTRQVEVYEHGQVLWYDANYSSDQYGMLTDQPLDLSDFQAYALSPTDFEEAWPVSVPAGAVDVPDGCRRPTQWGAQLVKVIPDDSGKREVRIVKNRDGSFGFEEWYFSEAQYEHGWLPRSSKSRTFAETVEAAEREAGASVDWLIDSGDAS